MVKKRKNKKMDQGKKNLLVRILQFGKNYFNNESLFSRKMFISKGYGRVDLKRKQGVIGK